MPHDRCCLDCGQQRGHYSQPGGNGGRGLCGKCYHKRYRDGLPMPPRLTTRFKDRLAEIDKPQDSCWLWTGPVNEGGYGVAGGGGKHGASLAHIRSYVHHKGPVQGLDVGHACHDADPSCQAGKSCLHRRCINPGHLVLQTRSENLRAKPFRTRCKRGLHEMSGDNLGVNAGTGGRGRFCKACAQKNSAEAYQRRKAAAKQAAIEAREFVRPVPGMPAPRPAGAAKTSRRLS